MFDDFTIPEETVETLPFFCYTKQVTKFREPEPEPKPEICRTAIEGEI